MRARRKNSFGPPCMPPLQACLESQSRTRQTPLEPGLFRHDPFERGDVERAAGLDEKAVEIESDQGIASGEGRPARRGKCR